MLIVFRNTIDCVYLLYFVLINVTLPIILSFECLSINDLNFFLKPSGDILFLIKAFW